MDTQLLENQIQGLEASLTALRAAENLFHKAKGLDEEAEKARDEADKKGVELQSVKEELAELRGQKAEALEGTCKAIMARMDEILPEGRAVLEIGDSVYVGWERPDGVRVPIEGLSGGQRVSFETALSLALMGKGHKVLVVEAAELDPVRLAATINRLTHTPDDVQILVNTWAAPAEVPAGWEMVVVK